MYRYVFEDGRHIPPFNQPASLLTIGITPLKLHQEEVLVRHFRGDLTLAATFPWHERDLPDDAALTQMLFGFFGIHV